MAVDVEALSGFSFFPGILYINNCTQSWGEQGKDDFPQLFTLFSSFRQQLLGILNSLWMLRRACSFCFVCYVSPVWSHTMFRASRVYTMFLSMVCGSTYVKENSQSGLNSLGTLFSPVIIKLNSVLQLSELLCTSSLYTKCPLTQHFTFHHANWSSISNL